MNKQLTYEELIKITSEMGVIQLRHQERIERLEEALKDTDTLISGFMEVLVGCIDDVNKNRYFIKHVFKEYLADKRTFHNYTTKRQIQKWLEELDQKAGQLNSEIQEHFKVHSYTPKKENTSREGTDYL